MSDIPSISVVEHDPHWRTLFEQERDLLGSTLAPWLAGPIEHVGSTAVPGLCAKPVIDIMVPVRNLETSKPATDLLEQRHGYHYWPYKTEVMHWLCKPSEHVRTHHLHIVPIDSPLWRERLMFRDALREDSDMRDRYSELKRRLAQAHSSDREAYTVGKTPFVAAELARLAQVPRK